VLGTHLFCYNLLKALNRTSSALNRFNVAEKEEYASNFISKFKQFLLVGAQTYCLPRAQGALSTPLTTDYFI